MLRAPAVVLVSIAAALAIAALVWAGSHGHVVFFPLILLFGVPFIPLLGRRKSG